MVSNFKMNKGTILATPFAFILGVGISWISLHRNNPLDHVGPLHEFTENKEDVQDSKGETIWTCAMHPQIKQNSPGTCPLCAMDLTPLEKPNVEKDKNLIQLSEHAAKIANVQTTVIESGHHQVQGLTLQGKVEVDERRITKIPAQFHGRIEKLFVNFTGEQVSKGKVLAEVYSPEIISAQEELLQSLKYKESNAPMYNAVKNKLKYWKISESEIERVEKTGKILNSIRITSQHSGVVLKRNVAQGDHVNMGDILVEIADLSKLWVLFDVYEKDLENIKVHTPMEFTVASLPGQIFKSKVSFIDPVIDPGTRVAKIRVEIDNTKGQLKPEMFATGQLKSTGDPENQSLLVPKSAVLWTGKQSLVYVKKLDFEEPTFEYRQIILGPEKGDFYVVETGLTTGEEVVTKAAFTIDAAAQLSGKASMMNSGLDSKPPQNNPTGSSTHNH